MRRFRGRIGAATAAVALAMLVFPATGEAGGSASTAVAHGPNAKAIRSAGVTSQAPRARMYYVGHAAGEPTIGFTKNGELFFTGSDGCVTSCTGSSQMLDTVTPGSHAILASKNGGKTWSDVSPKAGPAYFHEFSLDPMLYVDETTGRVFDSDLNLVCSEISYSDDHGASWASTPLGCGEPVNDHQTIFGGVAPKGSAAPVGYPHVMYYCINHPAFTRCDKSLNGGLAWIPSANIQPPSCSGLNGHGVADAKGTIYIPMGANCNQPWLAVSGDEGDTWRMSHVANMPASDQDPSVAVDRNGTLYYLFVGQRDRMPYLATSTNAGKSWSKPIKVEAPGVTAVNLATLDVGDPGKVAIAYYGTTAARGAFTTWNGYLSIARGVGGPHPVFYSAPVNDPAHPLKIAACGPGRCGRVLDFIDVEISPTGQAYGAYVDACLAGCEKTHKESIADNQGLVGTLVGGFRLR